ncbi:MFS transporter [Francisellaceae bacterium]|nr:MFS transporter [Francisellaceae bacterium]
MKSLGYIRWLCTEFFFTVSIFSAILFGTYAAQVQSNNTLSTSQLTLLSGIFFSVFAFSQLISGFLINKISTKVLLGVSGLLAGISALIFAYATSFPLLIVSRLMMGLGLGCSFVGVLYIIQLGFKESQFAFFSSLSQSISNIAAGALAVFGGRVLSTFSYHSAFMVLGILLIVSAAMMMTALPGKPILNKNDQDQIGFFTSLKFIFAKRNFWLATTYFSGIFATILTFADLFNVKYQVDVFNMPQYKAIMLNGLIPLGIAIGGVIAGFCSSKLQKNQLAASCFTALLSLSLSVLLLVDFPHGDQYLICLFFHLLFGIGCGGAMLAFQEIQYTINKPQMRPLANSLVLTIAYLFSGMILQPLVGFFIGNVKSENFDYADATQQQIAAHESTFQAVWHQFDKGLFILVIIVIIGFICSLFFTKPKAIAKNS